MYIRQSDSLCLKNIEGTVAIKKKKSGIYSYDKVLISSIDYEKKHNSKAKVKTDILV